MWPERLREGIVIGSDTVVYSSKGRLDPETPGYAGS